MLVWRTEMFSNDLLAFVVPAKITEVGGTHFLSTSSRFTAGIVEEGAYVGLPTDRYDLPGRTPPLAHNCGQGRDRHAGGGVVCSLRGRLHVDGATSIPLPWVIGHRLAALGLALPLRFVVYGFLIGSLLAALWLADARRRVAPWLLAALCVACIWPAVGLGFWRGTPELPSLFTSSRDRGVITTRDTALLPDMEGGAEPFLFTHRVTVAIIDPSSPQATPWIPILERLGWKAQTVGGAVVLRPN